MILDAADLNTTKRFYDEGVRNIHIPNPFECGAINRFVQNNPKFVQYLSIPSVTVGEYLRQILKNGDDYQKFTSAWFDYYNCYTGNKAAKVMPREDVKRLLKNGMMATPSILAITTSYRCGANAPDQIQLLLNDLSKWETPYCFEIVIAGKYHGRGGKPNMGIVILKLSSSRETGRKCRPVRTTYYEPEEFEKKIFI